jgi:hypothetical protein
LGVRSIVRRVSGNFLFILGIFIVEGVGLYTGVLTAKVSVFAFVVTGWIISLCLHEGAHAFAALRGGDRSVETRAICASIRWPMRTRS